MLLEAGAGTGKTGVMVDRYCRLVCDSGLPPDSILAFTFTDKAAAELRQRIRAELARRAGRGSERAAAALAGIGGAWITTIHGFCNRVLAAHPVAAGVDPNFRVLDAPEAARAAREAFDDAVVEFLADGEAAREETVAAYDLEGLRAMIAAVHDELRSRGIADPRLPEPPQPDPEAALARLVAAAEECLAELDESNGKRAASERELPERALELLRAPGAEPSLEELLALTTKSKAKTLAPYKEAVDAAVARVAEAGEGGVVYGHLAQLLELFSARFEAAKERRAGIDFEDLQILAARLLERAEIGEHYRSRFRQILVDEFQDTNRLQLRLIEALRGPKAELVVVGDELQSIYGFRHADLEVFRRRREEIDRRADAELMRLSGNFRSRPEVIGGGQPLRRGAARRRLHAAAGGRALASHARGRRLETGRARRRAAAHRPRRLGRRGDRAGAGDRRLDPAQLPGRGALRRRAAARAGRRRRAARRDGGAAARLHPPRRLRGLARTRRPAPLRGRRPRLLVPAAGGRRLRAAGGDRQPARRPRPLRRPRLPRLRGSPPTRSGCCAKRPASGATSGRRSSGRPAPARSS